MTTLSALRNRDARNCAGRRQREERTCGCISAGGTGSTVGARVIVVVEAVLVAGSLAAGLVCLRKRVLRRVRALVLLRRWVCLGLMLLVNDTRGSRVLQVLGRRRTLLLVLRMMLHREKTHQ